MTFLTQLPKPFTALAPMEDVTDTVFRQIIMRCGRPNIFFTEFLNVDGFLSVGRDAVAHRLRFIPEEKPILVQLWGNNPEKFYQAAQQIVSMGVDGIDINMGCPVSKVLKSGCGSALIDEPNLAKEIFLAVREASGDLSVSIKTRIGVRTKVTEEWAGFLLNLKPDLLTIHGRTAKELYKYSADWDEIAKVSAIRDEMHSQTLIMGNGDVIDYADAMRRAKQYHVDGVMIGRGVLRNLYAFNPAGDLMTPDMRLNLLLDHVRLFVKTWQNVRNFANLKKYFKTYISAIPGAPALRAELVQANSLSEVEEIIRRYKARK